MDQTPPEPLVAVGVIAVLLVGFPLFWGFIGVLVGLLSGWLFLGRRFRWKGPLPRRAATMVSGYMGLSSYSGVSPSALTPTTCTLP